MTDINSDDIRGRIQQVLDKAKGDFQFLEQFKSDPQATLQNAGLEADVARYIANQELNFSGDDVSGFRGCAYTCDRYTCLVSICGYVPYTNG